MRVIKSTVLVGAGTDEPITYFEYSGLKTETKPTDGVAMGSLFFEVDTGDVYAYNETAESWVKEISLQG